MSNRMSRRGDAQLEVVSEMYDRVHAERDAALAYVRQLEAEVARIEDARQSGREERDALETAKDSWHAIALDSVVDLGKAQERVRVLEAERLGLRTLISRWEAKGPMHPAQELREALRGQE